MKHSYRRTQRRIGCGILLACWLVPGVCAGQFVPGHVFASQRGGKSCKRPEENGSDRIWEINPDTGEATLFVQIPPELCGFMTGLAFTPDGSRLRASMSQRSEILEFDSQGNFTVVLDANDGIAAPRGCNNLAYDVQGNFYVAQGVGNILRFPVDGGPATVFAGPLDCGGPNAIAIAADGDLYCATTMFSVGQLRRMTPDGNAFPFDTFGGAGINARTVTADDSGHVYVVISSAELFKYDAGNPGSKELLAQVPCGLECSMTMSPDQSLIYLHSIQQLFSVDVADGTVITLAELYDGVSSITGGIAVVPIPPPIPTVSQWGVIAMLLLVLIAGTIVLGKGVPRLA